MIQVKNASVPSLKGLGIISEKQPKVLRLRLAQKMRHTPLRMAALFWCELQIQDTDERSLAVCGRCAASTGLRSK